MKFSLNDLLEFVRRYPIGVVCALVGAIMLGGFFIRNSRVDELSEQVKQVEDQGRIILNDIRNATGLAEHYATLRAATKDLESRLLQVNERARNQQYFYRLESDAGVKEVSLQATSAGGDSKAAGRRSYSPIGYTITVEGEYRRVLNFIGRLETGQCFYRLDSASIFRRGDGGATGLAAPATVTLNLELLGLP